MNTTSGTDQAANGPDTAHKPKLIMIRGLPGSGKSFLAGALQQAIGLSQVVLLDPDTIDFDSQAYKDLCAQLAAEGIEEKFFPNRYLKSVGYQAISAGKTVIWNQAFTLLDGFKRSVGSLTDFAAEQGIVLPVLVVEVQIDLDTAKARVAGRTSNGGHDVNEESFVRFMNDYHSFASEGFKTVSIDGTDDVATSVQTVLNALQDI